LSELNRRSFLVWGALLGAGTALATTKAGPTLANILPGRGRFRTIDTAVDVAVKNGDVSGVVAMAADRKGLIYEGTAGLANQQTHSPMAADTVFWMLSMTKAFTATAAMQLVEQGRLDLNAEAASILPQLKSPMVLEGFDDAGKPKLRPAKRPILVRHLLTHTSGYTYANWSGELQRYETTTGLPDITSLRNVAFDAPLEFDPGERWQYGISLDWVGKLVEQITDQSLEIYFRENIFEPLGMPDSGFLISSKQKTRVATCSSRQADGTLKPMPFEMPQRPEFFMGGGGAFSTPRDYMRFLRALVNGGSLDSVRILRPETVKTMMTNQIGALNVQKMVTAAPTWSNSFDQFPNQKHKWGYSFDINEEPGPNGRSAGSISWAGLLNCYYWVDPVKQVTGAIFTQTLPFYDARIVALFGAFERGFYAGLGSA
jgi:CubicO group peptidase (beta-lactamase class C family)